MAIRKCFRTIIYVPDIMLLLTHKMVSFWHRTKSVIKIIVDKEKLKLIKKCFANKIFHLIKALFL